MRRRMFLMLIPVVWGLLGCYIWGAMGQSSSNTPAAVSEASPPASLSPVDLSEVTIELGLITNDVSRPVGITHAGDGSERLFVVEKVGRIQTLLGGQVGGKPFLDISDRVGSSGSEQGLLGLAFHPDYPANGFFYVNYTDLNGDTVISRFSVTSSPDEADPTSETVILTQDQPAANHNGGNLVFGPDGYLYIGLGDGGGANDTYGNAQDTQSLLGKMLRIDVDADSPYGIPPDNPFVNDDSALDEIWAIGLRNPWRYSFDRLTGDLYIGDVGQGEYEEVNWQPFESAGGVNYGWPTMEGLHCREGNSCEQTGLALPIAEYDHSQGCSITGGYVYRGQAYESIDGVYFFGDYCSGNIWGLAPDASGRWHVAKLLETGIQLSSFGEDEAGELYVTDLSGAVYQIVTSSGN